jgi:stearoyl-CoA desaturase (delta-9 desaturase)
MNVKNTAAADPIDHDHDDHDLEPVTLTVRIVTIAAIIIPFAGFIAAAWLMWEKHFTWFYAGLLLTMYVLTAFGVTVGYHRYFTHSSFKTNRVVQALLGVLGSMAVEGPVLRWCAMHRLHHQCSDKPGDPHSPHEHGDGLGGVIKGFIHAHVGWMVAATSPARLFRYVPDLSSDKLNRFMDRTFAVWALLGLALPTVAGGLITMSWTGALLGFIWGGLVRVFLVHHVTWSVNSVCHIWGSRPFRSHDHSRNNFLFGVLAMGEGWHNNHHAFPTSARHGLKWWQIDTSYLLIKTLEKLGLAWDVKVPSSARLESKLAH